MRKILFAAFLMVLMLAAHVSAQESAISYVQNSRVYPTDPMTIGETYKNYKYLADQKWEAREDTDGSVLVRIHGRYSSEPALANSILDYMFQKNQNMAASFLNFLDSQHFHLIFTATYKIVTRKNEKSVSLSNMQIQYKDQGNFLNSGQTYTSIVRNQLFPVTPPKNAQAKIKYLFYKFVIQDGGHPSSFATLLTYAKNDMQALKRYIFTGSRSDRHKGYFSPITLLKINDIKFNDESNEIICNTEVNITDILVNPEIQLHTEWSGIIPDEEFKKNIKNYSIVYKADMPFTYKVSDKEQYIIYFTSHPSATGFENIIFHSPGKDSFSLTITDMDPIKIVFGSTVTTLSVELPDAILAAINSSVPDDYGSAFDLGREYPQLFPLKIADGPANAATDSKSASAAATTQATPSAGAASLEPGYFTTEEKEGDGDYVPRPAYVILSDGTGWITTEEDTNYFKWRLENSALAIAFDDPDLDSFSARLISPTAFELDGLVFNKDKDVSLELWRYNRTNIKGRLVLIHWEPQAEKYGLLVHTANKTNGAACNAELYCEANWNRYICKNAEGTPVVTLNRAGDRLTLSATPGDFGFCAQGADMAGSYGLAPSN